MSAGIAGGAGGAPNTEAELQRALDRGELVLHYQPIVRLAEETDVRGVQALVRWEHPEHGLVVPGGLPGSAEETGSIPRLAAWMLHEGCRQLAAWDAAGLGDGLALGVHLSPAQLDDDALAPTVAAALREHGLDAARLCASITAPAGCGAARLRALEELGVRIAVDARPVLAWSTGASGLDPAAVPVDVLTLDRRFVGRMDAEPRTRGVVGAVLELARSLGLQTVAEGIDRSEQACQLAELGCELGVGQAFAPASPADAVAPRLVRGAAVPARRIRAFLCDDAPALRHLLRSFLEWGDDVVVVGEAGDGEGLTEAVRAAGADLVLLDLSMPRVDGLEALAELRAAEPDLGIIVLSGFEAERMAPKALALGADRYLEKAAGMEDVRAAVRAVAAARRGTQTFAEVVL